MEFGAIKTARFGSICLTPIHCYSTHCTQEHPSKIDLIANGKKYIRDLLLNQHPVTTSYSITITDQQLTQIIHPRQTRRDWGWLNCNITSMSAE